MLWSQFSLQLCKREMNALSLSMIHSFACIAVVKGGKVVEQGTHDELVSLNGGAYATLIQLQLSGTEHEKNRPERLIDEVESVASDKVRILTKTLFLAMTDWKTVMV